MLTYRYGYVFLLSTQRRKIVRPASAIRLIIDADLVERRFQFNSVAHADSTRCGCFGALLFVYSKFVNSSCYPCFNCWCGCKKFFKFGYVNPSADPWTSSSYWTLLNIRQLDFYFVTSILDEAGRNIFSNIPSTGVQQFVKNLFWVSSISFGLIFIRGFNWVDFSWQV